MNRIGYLLFLRWRLENGYILTKYDHVKRVTDTHLRH